MADTNGSIAFDSGIKTDGLKKDLAEMEEAIADSASVAEKKAEAAFETMEKQAKRLAKAYEDAGMDASDALKKAWQDVQDNAEAFGTSASENFKGIGDAAEEAGTSIDGLAGKMQSALAAAGLAYGAKEIVDIGVSYEKAMNQVATSTGAAGAELESLQSIASNVYADNFGESMEDTAAGVAEIYKRTGLVDEELQKATESAYLLRDAFGYELNESTQAATQLMKVFGVTADEAYNLIAQGAQKGLDQNGDMLDTLNEYSVQFANLGYSAEDMFNMLANGVQNGTWSVDKLGDAVKEMNIRLNDGTADEALQALGLGFAESATDAAALKQAALDVSKAEVDLAQAQQNVQEQLSKNGSASLEYQDALNKAEQAQIDLEKAQADYNATVSDTSYNLDEIKGKLAAGGEDAQAAIQEIMTALSQVEDEQDRYVLGQTLMGTMWEDLGEDAVNALMNTQGEISTTTDALEEMADVQYDDLGSRMEALKRKIETEIVVPVAQKYMPKIEKAIDYVSEHLDEIVEHAKPIAAAIATAFAVKKVTNFATSAVNTAKTVKTAFQTLNASNPLGWIALGVSALAGLETALRNAASKHQEYLQNITDKAAELPEELQKSIDTTKELSDSWESMQENMKSDGNAEFFDYEAAEKAKESLMALINADGTIKDGQEEKVQNLIDQLNQYGDTGLSVSDGIITKNGEVVGSYNNISGAIDEVIEKQHAQNLMEIAESGYKEALENRQKLLDNEAEYAKTIQNTEQSISSTRKELEELYKVHGMGTDINGNMIFDAKGAARAEELQAALEGYEKKLGETKTAREENNQLLKESLSYESQYLQMQDSFVNGDYDKVAEGYAKVSSGFITASTGTRAELKQQVIDFKEQYENLLELSKTNPNLVTDEQLQQAKYLWEQSMIELETATGEHAGSIGKTFIDTLSASGMSESEQLTTLNEYIRNRLNDGDSLDEIAKQLGVDFTSGIADGAENNGVALEEATKALIYRATQNLKTGAYDDSYSIGENMGRGMADGIDAVAWEIATSAINAVTAAINAAKSAADIRSPSHIMRDEVGFMLGEGTALGIKDSIPDVSAISSDMANAAVSSTLGIMNAQGTSAVAPYNPVFTQAYSAPQQNNTQPAAPTNSTPQNGGDIIIPISIGDETIETVVVNAVTRANASSGGWSV